LITTYVIRIVISVIFPIAFIVDMMCGMVSSIVLYPIGLDVPKHDLSVGAVYLWTVAQGAVLNVVLGIVWAVLFAIFALAMGPDPVTHED
jgi:ABC-type thiamin/hydroxymethylpyrimidine transport system permease subunit